ncbi:MAG TPA: transglutaminase family protein [Sporichthya sp.]|nr:transglutaminase family protein [Sporichthya sp.]
MSEVASKLTFEATSPVSIVLQVAVARRKGAGVQERLEVVNNGVPLPTEELPSAAEGRQHLFHAQSGSIAVTYDATVSLSAAEPAPVTTLERVEALRPSRYCPSDRMAGFAQGHFDQPDAATRVRAICDYVWRYTDYVFGTSGPTTDAADTLESGQGVCRDFAHLVATLCRAALVPARVAAVYAPGLAAMDLHVVVETEIDGFWQVWDATRLAPRQTLVRIATGRDAADIAFATVLSGEAQLTELNTMAIADGDLPFDDHQGLAVLR